MVKRAPSGPPVKKIYTGPARRAPVTFSATLDKATGVETRSITKNGHTTTTIIPPAPQLPDFSGLISSIQNMLIPKGPQKLSMSSKGGQVNPTTGTTVGEEERTSGRTPIGSEYLKIPKMRTSLPMIGKGKK